MPRIPARSAIRLCCLLLSMILGLLIAGCGDGTDPAYVAEVDAWHAERVERLSSPTGWLTLVGLHGLGQGPNELGSADDNDAVLVSAAPAHLGTVTLAGDRARFQPAAGTTVHRFVDGTPDSKPFLGGEIRTDGQGTADQLAAGSLVFYVIQRGERFFLRVKDTQARTLQEFKGIERYPARRSWRVEARLTGEAGTVRVTNVLGQVAPEPTPGILTFELAGQTYSLQPTGEPGGEMFVVFGDQTNGHGTYPGGRFLVVDAPDSEGRVFLDFNRAYNPPCVFSSFATCPLPVAENMLPIAVTAGEKMWGAGH